jgi:hypothetical protein
VHARLARASGPPTCAQAKKILFGTSDEDEDEDDEEAVASDDDKENGEDQTTRAGGELALRACPAPRCALPLTARPHS